jgi:hypothetical protein
VWIDVPVTGNVGEFGASYSLLRSQLESKHLHVSVLERDDSSEAAGLVAEVSSSGHLRAAVDRALPSIVHASTQTPVNIENNEMH